MFSRDAPICVRKSSCHCRTRTIENPLRVLLLFCFPRNLLCACRNQATNDWLVVDFVGSSDQKDIQRPLYKQSSISGWLTILTYLSYTGKIFHKKNGGIPTFIQITKKTSPLRRHRQEREVVTMLRCTHFFHMESGGRARRFRRAREFFKGWKSMVISIRFMVDL